VKGKKGGKVKVFADRAVYTAKLEDAVSKFLEKERRTERSNVPQRHTALDQNTRRQIQRFQQLNKLLVDLVEARKTRPSLTSKLDPEIEK